MIPGEIFAPDGGIELNAGATEVALAITNSDDRPVQVGSHYHFYETNQGVSFDRAKARRLRLNIAAGNAVRFEPGRTREVPLSGKREVVGFQQKNMVAL